jgi:hypothetical protein
MKPPRPYPGYDVLAKRDSPSWDDTTRRVVADRLRPPAPRFLDARAFATLEALCDTAVPQPDRADPIPLAAMVDAAIAECRTTGTRWRPLPPMQEAWSRALALIDAEAEAVHGRPFASLPGENRASLLHAIDRSETRAPWDLPPRDVLRKVVLDEIVRAYYAHPAAWSEIGFGGPASPRGYVRLAAGRQEPWEAPPGRR